jgi:hypothetical protein
MNTSLRPINIKTINWKEKRNLFLYSLRLDQQFVAPLEYGVVNLGVDTG